MKGWEQPEVLNTDKAPAYAAAIAEFKAEGKVVAYGDVCHGAPLLNGVIAGRARRPRSG